MKGPTSPTAKKLCQLLTESIDFPIPVSTSGKREREYVLTAARLLATRSRLSEKLEQAKGSIARLESGRDILVEAKEAGFVPLGPRKIAYRFDQRGPDAIAKDGFQPNRAKKPGTLLDHVYGLGFGNGSFVSCSSKAGNTSFLQNPYSLSSTVPDSLISKFREDFHELTGDKRVNWKPGNEPSACLVVFEYKVKGDRFVRPGPNTSPDFYSTPESEVVTDHIPGTEVLQYRIVASFRYNGAYNVENYRVVGPWAKMTTPVESYAQTFEKTKFETTPKESLIGLKGEMRPGRRRTQE
jgi:hypothetical protein